MEGRPSEGANSAVCGRTAPSTSGLPHPGTALSALLAWLDARGRGGRFVVRLEDLDRTRTRPAFVEAIGGLCDWLGLDYDALEVQSDNHARHCAALDGLAVRGLLYSCTCSRQRLRGLPGATGEVGTAAYDNQCRALDRPLDAAGWRASPHAIRLRLQDADADRAGCGDPIVRRRDGIVAYALASVVDDAAQGVTRVVRGRDLAVHAPLHAAIYRTLQLPVPTFVHHPLLLAGRRAKDGAASQPVKLAKLHGDCPVGPATAWSEPTRLIGALAAAMGLTQEDTPMTPHAVLKGLSCPPSFSGKADSLWLGAASDPPCKAC